MVSPLLFNLFYDVGRLKNIGPKRLAAYHRVGIRNIRDLIFHLPYQSIDRRSSPPLRSVISGQIITVAVVVRELDLRDYRAGRRPHKIICSNESGYITLLYFNGSAASIGSKFEVGRTIVISGKAEYNKLDLQMVHPDIVSSVNDIGSVMVVEPVYHVTYALNSRFLWLTINSAIKFLRALPEWIPDDIMKSRRWASWLESINRIHNPQNPDEVTGDTIFRQRIAFDEIFAMQLGLCITRRNYRKQPKVPINFTKTLVEKLKTLLPFELTNGQKKAIEEIECDQKSAHRMARVLLGDVGCGKTLVALCAMLNVVEAGKQAVLMAPTELLAKQHFANIQKFCEQIGVRVGLLVSKMPTQKHKEIREAIMCGKLDIVIGTHALFQEQINFSDVGIAIIDEQHRFGVEHRSLLAGKGKNVDFLMMSATPIPRTLCMLHYGDLDLSIIKEKPAKRAQISTSLLAASKLPALIDRVKAAAMNGQKIYWICPLIEESESMDLTHITERFETLSAIGISVGIMHGRMPAIDRDNAMADFLAGKTRVLVATTVVEVGVDVPDATVIVIENAERFGLSQLHQLRGRVGRGSMESHCILLYGHPLSEAAKARLNVIRQCDDGFAIAEADLNIRGAGDILGTKQSGLPTFRTCNIALHGHFISEAQEIAKGIIEVDPELSMPKNAPLRLLLEIYEQDKRASS